MGFIYLEIRKHSTNLASRLSDDQMSVISQYSHIVSQTIKVISYGSVSE